MIQRGEEDESGVSQCGRRMSQACGTRDCLLALVLQEEDESGLSVWG